MNGWESDSAKCLLRDGLSQTSEEGMVNEMMAGREADKICRQVQINNWLMQIDLAEQQIANPHYNFHDFKEGRHDREANLKGLIKLHREMLRLSGISESETLTPSSRYVGIASNDEPYNLDEMEQPTAGPLNYIHELSGNRLKDDAVRAVRYARINRAIDLDELRDMWQNRLLRRTTKHRKEITYLEDYAYMLFLEQNRYSNLGYLKDKGFSRPFDFQTCLDWVYALIIDKTWEGITKETTLQHRLNSTNGFSGQIVSSNPKVPPIHDRADQKNLIPSNLRAYTPDDATDKGKADLVIADRRTKNVVAIIQVKPTSWGNGKKAKDYKKSLKKWNKPPKCGRKVGFYDFEDGNKHIITTVNHKIKPYIMYYSGNKWKDYEVTLDRISQLIRDPHIF